MLKESNYVKIRIATPLSNSDIIREVLAKNGAGVQGNYDSCSGSYSQTGRFRPLDGSRPKIGQVGEIEKVAEEIIETICHKDKIERVVSEIIKAHPYEEPAIDIIPRLEVV